MRINKPQYPYLLNKNINIFDLLNTLQINKTIPIILTNDDSSIYGIISEGDFIDFIAVNPNINLSEIKVEDIANKLPLLVTLMIVWRQLKNI